VRKEREAAERRARELEERLAALEQQQRQSSVSSVRNRLRDRGLDETEIEEILRPTKEMLEAQAAAQAQARIEQYIRSSADQAAVKYDVTITAEERAGAPVAGGPQQVDVYFENLAQRKALAREREELNKLRKEAEKMAKKDELAERKESGADRLPASHSGTPPAADDVIAQYEREREQILRTVPPARRRAAMLALRRKYRRLGVPT